MAKYTRTYKIELDKTKSKEEREYEGVREFADYWRQNPQKFIADWMGYEGLTWYQDMIIYIMFRVSVFFWIACRGISKSYMIAWFLVSYCILFPRSRFVIASGTRGQSRLIITTKILGELYNRYPRLQQEIEDYSVSFNDTFVKFRGGSEIVVVTGSDSARGNRACGVIYEEARTLDKNTIENVLRKFKQNGDRRPRWKDNPKYRNIKTNEPKKDIYISSGWFANDYFCNISMDAYNAMVAGKNQALLSMHWGFPVVEGFMDYEEDILQEKDSSEFSQMWWSIENEGLFWNDSEASMFGYKELDVLRKLENAFKPVPNELYLEEKALRAWNKKNFIQKQKGELRILGLDVAMMGGSRDNSVFTVLRLLPNGSRYRRQLAYIEHHNNAHSEEQSIRMKQLYDDFDIDFVCVDVHGAGIGVADASSKVQYDNTRDKEYPAWTVFNREDMKDRSFGVDVEDALPLIYGIKQDAKFNHFMLQWLKSTTENRRIELLVNANKAEDIITDLNENIDTYELEKELQPFRETDLLVKEMTSLEVLAQNNSPYLKVDNKVMRKDRFSSLGFCNYYANILEQDLSKNKKKKSKLSSFIAFN